MTTQVIYIAGYGRSGSTVLDTALGNHPEMLGAGELTWLFRYAQQQQPCTCSQLLGSCPVWAPVLHRSSLQSGCATWAAAADVTLDTEAFGDRRGDRARYHRLWGEVFRTLREQTGCAWVVDSSKSTRQTYHRLELLHEIPEVRLHIVHLVRDPRGVMWSIRRGSNRRLEAGAAAGIRGGSARALISWMVANQNVERFRRRYPEAAYHRLRYEDLVRSPRTAFTELAAFLQCDLGNVIDLLETGQALQAGHGVSGNRTRRTGTLQLRVDDEWQTQLPHFDRLLARLARPWLRSYNY